MPAETYPLSSDPTLLAERLTSAAGMEMQSFSLCAGSKGLDISRGTRTGGTLTTACQLSEAFFDDVGCDVMLWYEGGCKGLSSVTEVCVSVEMSREPLL